MRAVHNSDQHSALSTQASCWLSAIIAEHNGVTVTLVVVGEMGDIRMSNRHFAKGTNRINVVTLSEVIPLCQ